MKLLTRPSLLGLHNKRLGEGGPAAGRTPGGRPAAGPDTAAGTPAAAALDPGVGSPVEEVPRQGAYRRCLASLHGGNYLALQNWWDIL